MTTTSLSTSAEQTETKKTSLSRGVCQWQRTVERSVSASGIGLFSGEKAEIVFVPAPPDHGIVFQRVDLPGQPKIPAKLEHVQAMPRCTALGKEGVSVQTVEHLLSALSGLGITNLLIEIAGPEVPIFDGSSAYFVRMVQEAGICEQKEKRRFFTVAKPFYWSQGDVSLVALPSHEFKVSYTLSYPKSQLLQSQFFAGSIDEDAYRQEIAPCRTFSVYEEIEPFIKKGFIKGGSLENAVLIKEDIVVNPEGLRCSDEMVRHKVLDLIGDFSLMGNSLLAHIVAIRSGHASNIAFAKELMGHLQPISESANKPVVGHRSKEGVTMSAQTSKPSSIVMGIKEISKILPHRYPFLLVDRVTYLNVEEQIIIAQKNLTMNEQFFQGHFPNVPLMPGVLVLEALAQAGGILVHEKGYKGKIAVLLTVNNAKFRRPVAPGDVLTLHVTGLHFSSKGGKVLGRALINEQLAAEAEIGFALIDWEKL